MIISELRLLTSSCRDLINFYSNIFSLPVSIAIETEIKIKLGSTNLIFTEDKSISPYYHFAVNIPENQITEAIAWLKLKVKLIKYEGTPLIDFPNWNAHSVYFYDPAGNIVELIARHNLNNSSNEPFSQKSFLNISEIGLPVENVKAFHDIISSNMGVELWNGNLEIFAAIGDENGLLIVVNPHRNWFPTDKPCNIYPLTVKISNKYSESIVLEHSQYKIITG